MTLCNECAVLPRTKDDIISNRKLIKLIRVWNIDDRKFAYERKLVKELRVEFGANKVIREDKKVFVVLASVAPNYGVKVINVKHDDEVTIIQTNLDKVEDLTHGFCLSNYNINFGVSPGETVSVTFRANKKGVYWYYCPWFCHALHLEMRGRLLVS